MACTSNNVPYALWRLRIFSDIFLPPTQVQISRRGQRRCLYSSRELRDNSDSSNRDDNKNTSLPNGASSKPDSEEDDILLNDTRPSASLPQSPLVELAKRYKAGNKTRKPRGTKADFDRLSNNPWAVALASPIRQCALTHARLPMKFLTEMGLVRRVTKSDDKKSPNYGSIWWMPTGLLKDELKATVHPEQGSLNNLLSKGKPRVLRLLSRALLFRELPKSVDYDSGGKVRTRYLLSPIWKMDNPKLHRLNVTDMIWRQDMPEFVLKHMGKEVVKALKEVCRYEQIKKSEADMWREIPLSDMSVSGLTQALREVEMKDMETGGVIIMGDPAAASVDRPSDVFSSAFTSAFPDYITLPQTGSMIPVYDLSVMLSRSDLEALRQSHPRFNERALFFRPDGPKSVSAMINLWNIKGYVMHDAEFLAIQSKKDPVVEPSVERSDVGVNS